MTQKALIVVHDNHQEINVFPLGAGYVAATLRDAGVEVETYCMDVLHYSNADIEEHLKTHTYDFVMLGFMMPRFKRTVRSLCETIRSNIDENTWFVLGGYGPSALPEYILEQTKADIVCMGEADYTVVELAKCKLNGTKDDLSDVLGIVYSHNDKVHFNEKRPKNKQLDLIPFPAWDLFPMDLYTKSLKFAGMGEEEMAFPLVSTRGCTDKCTFCFRLEKGIRSRTPENVLEEMIYLHKTYGITYFYFCDELAIISKKQIMKLTAAFKEHLPNIHYRMDCRVTLFDDDIALALKESGCVFLNIGFESSSQIVLDQMQKRSTVEMNINAAEMAIKYGIGMGLNTIWGMPGDNEESIRDNVKFIKKYNQYDQVRTIRPVTPYPGSPLYYQAINEGKLGGPQDFFDRFTNSDRYMVNFMEMDEDKVYELLSEVNTDLITDHFENTTGDMEEANRMITSLLSVYKDKDYNYTGPRNWYSNKHLRGKYKTIPVRVEEC